MRSRWAGRQDNQASGHPWDSGNRQLCHRYLVKQLARHFEEVGIKAIVQIKQDDGKIPDLILKLPEDHPFELQRSDKVEDALGHLREHVKLYQWATMAFTDSKLMEKVKERVQKEMPSESDKILLTTYKKAMVMGFGDFFRPDAKSNGFHGRNSIQKESQRGGGEDDDR